MKIFNTSPKDSYLVIVTLISLVFPFVFAYNFSQMGILPIVVSSLLMIVLANIHLNTSIHYHIHHPIFVSKLLNRIYELISSSPILIGFQEFKYIHIEHHKYNNDKIYNGKIGDPVSTFRFGKDGKEEEFISYIFKSSFTNYFTAPDLIERTHRMDRNKAKYENWIKLLTIFGLLLLNYKFVPLYILIIYLSWTLNAALSYCEHHNAVDTEDTKRDSTSCYNWVYNFLLFNSGYHQEHHYRPGCHWTKLPEITKQLPTDRNIVKYTLFNNNPFR